MGNLWMILPQILSMPQRHEINIFLRIRWRKKNDEIKNITYIPKVVLFPGKTDAFVFIVVQQAQ